MKVAALQMTSGPDVAANLAQAQALLEEAAQRGARLAALPENFSFMGLKDADKRSVAEAEGREDYSTRLIFGLLAAAIFASAMMSKG